MPHSGQRPFLMDFLSSTPKRGVTERQRFWGGSYIRLYNYCQVLSFLYECGAIIGRALSDKLGILERLLVLPNSDLPSMTGWEWQQETKERLRRYRERFKNDPNTFQEFIFARELEIATVLHPLDSVEAYEHGNNKVLEPFDKKVPIIEHDSLGVAPRISKAETKIREFILEGIGFGVLFPELTEKMNRNFYESVDIDWDTWAPRRFQPHFISLATLKVICGLPGEPTILSLEAQEETLLRVVGYYVASYYPELIDPLNLSRCQDEHSTGFSRYRGWWEVYHSLY